jgi:hypothetical protein
MKTNIFIRDILSIKLLNRGMNNKPHEVLQFNIVAIYVRDYRRGLDWWMDLLTTYTHDSELQVITAPLLISTTPLAHAKSSQSSLNVS